MSQEHDGDEGVSDARSAYEPPALVLVGNLNDLLAGVGSQNADLGVCSGATGDDVNPCV
jgi:hypothetical protein